MHDARKINPDIDNIQTEVKELKAVIQMRSHLQSNVAHDLRTPLASIRGYARMIVDGRAGEVNAAQKDYLRVITENTDRMLALVSWMSYVSDLSIQNLTLSTFDLRDVWSECLGATRSSLDEKSIQITEDIADESFAMMGDRNKLAYVFTQLLATAVKFTSSGSSLAVNFSHGGRDRDIRFKISSNGPGSIPPEILSRIFDRSVNAFPVLTAQSADVDAISLSGVYDVVGIHGGRLFVNSTAGQGSTFLFTLPAVTFDGEEKPGHEQAVNTGRR